MIPIGKFEREGCGVRTRISEVELKDRKVSLTQDELESSHVKRERS